MPISATFQEMKAIKTRKVVQLVFEIPIEAADKALKELGGYPQAHDERWVGIARLTEEPERAEPEEKPKRHLSDMSLAQVAGIFCGDPKFWAFLNGKTSMTVTTAEKAADFVRAFCNVDSRALLDRHKGCGEDFRRLWTEYDMFTGKQASPQ